MCKIKKILIDEKRHIRFGDWNGNDVSSKHFFHRIIFLGNFFIYFSKHFCGHLHVFIFHGRMPRAINRVTRPAVSHFGGR